MDANVYINRSACGCRNPGLRCDRVVLESKKTDFTVRTLSAEKKGDQGLDSWDLSAFRLPRTEKFLKAAKNEKVKTLELKFADVNGKL